MKTYISIGALICFTVSPPAFAQGNTYCKTGSDGNLPSIKIKIKTLEKRVATLKNTRTSLRAQLEPLKDEILALDKQIKPIRDKHQRAAKKSQKSAKSYAKYKVKWLDTGDLNRLNGMIKTRKQKFALYTQMLEHYRASDTAFKSQANRYQNIARDMLDKNRDCAAALTALQ